MNKKIQSYLNNIDFENIGIHIFSAISYLIVTVIYDINLYNFNQCLIGKSYIEIMTYENGKAWYYLIGAILLVVICAFLIYYFWTSRYNLETSEERTTVIILFIVILFCGISVIYYIQNPILKAAFTCIIVGTGICSSKS